MDRREFIGAVTLGVLAAPLAALAQPAGKVPRIGILDPGIPHLFAAFREAMRDLGYVEGRTIVYEVKNAEGHYDRIPALAAELVALGPDVIVTAATAPIRAVKQATGSIPIVVAAIGDAVASGFATSLRQPGGNITGLSFLNAELSAKRLQLLKTALPRLACVGALSFPGGMDGRPETQAAAQRLGLRVQLLEVRNPDDLEPAFEAAKKGRAEAIDVLASAFFNAHRHRIVELAAMHRLPAMYESREYVDAGGLMAYGQNLFDLFRRAATYVDRILKGAKPGDLPFEQPTTFDFVINTKTAERLGVKFPPSILLQATEVIR